MLSFGPWPFARTCGAALILEYTLFGARYAYGAFAAADPFPLASICLHCLRDAWTQLGGALTCGAFGPSGLVVVCLRNLPYGHA